MKLENEFTHKVDKSKFYVQDRVKTIDNKFKVKPKI